ncbi:ABC transporter ATP-binding protein [Terrilactibacillus laevilacticus]|uniref:ABC transporter ATP-binding protein n=1 Tax=Terrilactibacillus laevilacticus TaxID=1380157 RepID=UPI0011462AF8|nr:ABC transporter ATP-binding protein [Terrilactibacillus laevilacticus]
MIQAENVSYKRVNKDVLKNISWQVKEGEHWCLVGLNGAGKSTLLNMVNGYIWPTEGSMTVLNQIFGQVDLRNLRQSIGWVSSSLQQQLHNDEVVENIVLSGKFATIGLYDDIEDRDREKAYELMGELHCHHLAKRNYDTLSQGEKQRVIIARALMANPKLLILDEPCTGLDILARETLLSIIEELAKKQDAPTLIYVTHHVEEILPCFSHTLLLKNGTVFDSGRTEELMNAESLSAFYDRPVHLDKQDERLYLRLTKPIKNSI